jgi:protein-S-isoprenylcysteine O-methyltransferase Ste14
MSKNVKSKIDVLIRKLIMNHDQSEKKVKLTKAGIFAVIAPFRWMIFSAIAFYSAAGTIRVTRFWIYLGIVFIGAIISAVIAVKFTPELMNQRGKRNPGTKKWDLFLVIPFILILIVIVPLIAGFDLVRFQWTYLGYPYLIAGLCLYVVSFFIIQWSMIVNKHFETTVRIQNDRDHKVITSGPYKIIRHPGYTGMVLTSISLPLLLGSIYAFIPVCISLILLLIRTYKEDATLQAELDGYSEYVKITKYRLIPFVW